MTEASDGRRDGIRVQALAGLVLRADNGPDTPAAARADPPDLIMLTSLCWRCAATNALRAG